MAEEYGTSYTGGSSLSFPFYTKYINFVIRIPEWAWDTTMKIPIIRDDISRFVIHLTRRYGGKQSRQNLVSILDQRNIEARTAHCLFSPLFDKLKFTPLLKSKFKTVCFTETPLNQISRLCSPLPGRQSCRVCSLLHTRIQSGYRAPA